MIKLWSSPFSAVMYFEHQLWLNIFRVLSISRSFHDCQKNSQFYPFEHQTFWTFSKYFCSNSIKNFNSANWDSANHSQKSEWILNLCKACFLVQINFFDEDVELVMRHNLAPTSFSLSVISYRKMGKNILWAFEPYGGNVQNATFELYIEIAYVNSNYT